ncbi:LOW QUALITY PROTEIN: tyrosine-protein phosphatase non-receptor type 23-like [Amblyraja radiata]|uniref:LOW QUALITY PROTEIN: tyrosine-protein phosphatase non-receptor type 23-like n=1 Tax=Amblyraja radiata TaxID=386614 RepID=UPI001401D052|nr:LOW QUALITY PROTEIN: tyrosine-protein phosphatase non-receptor type 23-like [Amblyraja radiata]
MFFLLLFSSEEKAKLLREVVDKIDAKNEVLEQFMDSLRIDPDSMDNLDMFNHIPPVLMEKCAALSVRPDTVKSLVQSMQILSGLYTDVEASLRELKELMDEDESMEKKCQEVTGKLCQPSGTSALSKEWVKYMEVHEKASFTNTELHKAMNLHISNLRLLSGPLEDLRAALPSPTVTDEDKAILQNMKRILLKSEEMRDQRSSLLQQLRDAIQKDDITTTLVTTDHSEMKKLFEEQLKKYDQLRVYIDQNLAAQENILKALTDANVKYAAVRKALTDAEQKWNDATQMLVTSFEAYEDLMKKSQEGKEFYADLENKVTKLLDKMKDICKSQEEQRQALLEQEMKKKPPPRPTAPKPLQKPSDAELEAMSNIEDLDMQTFNAGLPYNDLPNELTSLPPSSLAAHPGGDARNMSASSPPPAPTFPTAGRLRDPVPAQPHFTSGHFPHRGTSPQHLPPNTICAAPSMGHPYSTGVAYRQHGLAHAPPSPHLAYQGSSAGRLPGVQTMPQTALGIRPSTTTVDSVQTPSPASRRSPPGRGQAARCTRRPSGSSPAAAVAPVSGVGVVCQYPYQPRFPNMPPFPPPAQRAYPHPAPLHPDHQRQMRPVMISQPPYQTPFYPQSGLPYQPQPRAQSSAHMPPPQPQVHPQHGMQPQLRPHLYQQHPAQEPVHPPTHPGNAGFPVTLAGVQPQIPAPMVPQRHALPTATEAQSRALLPASPGLPPQQPFTPHLHPALQPVPLPNMAAPQPVPLPGHMVAPQPVPLPNMAAPQPVPLPGHMVAPQPVPLPNMAAPQPVPLPGHMVALQPVPLAPPGPPPAGPLQPFSSGPSLPPTPSPSPTPVAQGQAGSLPAAAAGIQQRASQTLAPAATQPGSDLPFQRQNSSTDDLLSSSPDGQHGGAQTAVTQPLLLPTKADAKDGHRPKGIQIIEQDPYEKPEHVKMLLNQLGSFKVIVDSLDRPSFGSLTELDCKWKDLQDAQEKDARQLSIAIARCYTMKNRHQDIMPYDKNRIVIQSGKDDYINASMVEDLSSYCPRIIATQAPLLGTASDFWLMIYEQKVSLVVMLVSEQEVDKQKVLRYFPTERGQQIAHGPITLTLTTQKITQTHVERMIGLQYRDQSLKRTIIHLQFTSWPELGFPESKSHLLRFIQEVHGHYLHQRPLHTPVVVHCSSGVRRTGAFCLVYAAVQEVEAGNGIPDLPRIVRNMRQQRKHMLHDKLQLKYCYEAILKHVEQVLLRHGVATNLSTKAPTCSSQKSYSRQEPQDLVLGGDLPISSIQATIAKLSIRACAGGAGEGRAGPLPPLEPGPDPPPILQQDPPIKAPRAVEEPPSPPPPTLPAETTLDTGQPSQAPDTSGTTHTPSAANHTHTETEAESKAASLDLLASLTAEAFTLDTNPRNRQKISKHNFLQHQNNGQGLQTPTTGEDPLSQLDPLWTLNKT